jgi:hypothetical protein
MSTLLKKGFVPNSVITTDPKKKRREKPWKII